LIPPNPGAWQSRSNSTEAAIRFERGCKFPASRCYQVGNQLQIGRAALRRLDMSITCRYGKTTSFKSNGTFVTFRFNDSLTTSFIDESSGCITISDRCGGPLPMVHDDTPPELQRQFDLHAILQSVTIFSEPK
jgi:hypothetical protein